MLAPLPDNGAKTALAELCEQWSTARAEARVSSPGPARVSGGPSRMSQVYDGL